MKNMPTSIGMLSHSVLNCRSRRKRHLAWEEADCQSNGLYGHYLREIAERFPTLTLMELDLKYGAKLMENYMRSCLGQVTIFLARFFSVLDYSLF